MTDQDKQQLSEYRSALPQTPEALQNQRRQVNEILRSVMQRGVHFDVIGRRPKPNETPKPGDYSLLKPGAELLLQTFHIGVKRRVESISHNEEVHYRVHSQGFYLPTGHVIGEGVGECSSREEKYAWREAVCDDEFNMFPNARRRVKFKTQWYQGRPSGHKAIQQVRQDPQDQANTVLKMASKRADVDLVRTALAVSDIFSDPGEPPVTPPGGGPAAEPPPQTGARRAQEEGAAHRGQVGSFEEAAARHARPRQTGQDTTDGPPQTLQPNHVRMIRSSLENSGVDELALLHQFKIDALESLPFAHINDVLEWLRAQPSREDIDV